MNEFLVSLDIYLNSEHDYNSITFRDPNVLNFVVFADNFGFAYEFVLKFIEDSLKNFHVFITSISLNRSVDSDLL